MSPPTDDDDATDLGSSCGWCSSKNSALQYEAMEDYSDVWSGKAR